MDMRWLWVGRRDDTFMLVQKFARRYDVELDFVDPVTKECVEFLQKKNRYDMVIGYEESGYSVVKGLACGLSTYILPYRFAKTVKVAHAGQRIYTYPDVGFIAMNAYDIVCDMMKRVARDARSDLVDFPLSILSKEEKEELCL
jgi:hypothetical protein